MRPSCDVVVPFHGPEADLDALVERLAKLDRDERDTVTVVDNRVDGGPSREVGAIRVLAAPELQTPSYARNRGAESGTGEWLVFVDADADPEPDLLARYFERAPSERTAVLAGAVVDSAPDERRAALRYASLTAFMRQDETLDRERFGYAKTVNCAVRRDAFERASGFADRARAGEDADLCFRLVELGFEIEARFEARVSHRPRATVTGLLGQYFNHGSGAAWAARRHAGSFPADHWLGLALWGAKRIAAGLAAMGRGDRDGFILGTLDALCGWSFRLGRLRPNERRGGGVPRAQPRARPGGSGTGQRGL